MQIMLVAFAVVAFLTGYVMGSFRMMILVYAGGVFLTTLITVPNWPFFNRHPLKWLDPSLAEKYPKPQPQEPVVSKKKPAKNVRLETSLMPKISQAAEAKQLFLEEWK
ncbi:hypothetical protein IC575_023642 [Cucumis melo]